MAVPERTYLAECFLPGVSPADVSAAGDRAREAVLALRAAGQEIEYLGATLVAEDEVVFHAFAAPDARVVAQAGRQADLRFERIVESIRVGAGTMEPRPGPAGVQLEGDRA